MTRVLVPGLRLQIESVIRHALRVVCWFSCMESNLSLCFLCFDGVHVIGDADVV